MSGLRRFANKRDMTEKAIFGTLRALGVTVYPLNKPVDALCLYRGSIYLIECKTKRGKLTEAQEAFAAAWPIHVLRTVDDAIAFAEAAAEITIREAA